MVISIITPSFNQGGYIAETIESVLTQEGDFTLDYLIIDGGSDDDSVSIIKHYERLLAEGGIATKCRGIRYRWFSENDSGQAEALMKGFHLAEGEILAWINSDDVYLPGTLNVVSQWFRDNPESALFYGAAHYTDESGKIIGRYPTEKFDLKKLAYFNFFCQPSTFFRRNVFENVGGLDDSLNYAMDYDLFIRIATRYPCSYTPAFFSKYRLHETSKTMNSESLLKYHEEILHLTLKHFNWAPLNQVYGFCNYYIASRLPIFLQKLRFVVIGSSFFCTVVHSIRLNRGLKRQDLKLLNQANLKKIFQNRLGIIRGRQEHDDEVW